MNTEVEVSPGVEALYAGMERVVAMFRRIAPPDGLSLTAASTLRTLETTGPCRLSELATVQGISQPAMTQLVTRLERDGYARRGGSPEDARVVLVSLTPRGRELLQRRRRARTHALHEQLGTLSDADRELVFAAVPALNLLAGLGQPDDRSRLR